MSDQQKKKTKTKRITRKEYKRRARIYFIAGAILIAVDAFILHILRTY